MDMKKLNIKGYLKDYLPCVIAGVVVLVMMVAFSSVRNTNRQQISDITSQIQDVQTKIDQASATRTSIEKEVKVEASGLDTARVQTDDKVAKDFFEKILTWSTYEEYEGVRNRLIQEYDLGESTLLSTFFPEIEIVKDSDGNEYNLMDAMQASGEPLNLEFVDMTSHVTKIAGSDYSYFTEVTVSSTAQNGGMATGECVFVYTVDENGTLSNLQAYTVAE